MVREVQAMPEDDYLAVTMRPGDDEVVLEARGEIDLASVSLLKWYVDEATACDYRVVVIDLSEVTFLDSSGLAVFAVAHSDLTRAGRELVLRGADGTVKRVLDLCGFDQATSE